MSDAETALDDFDGTHAEQKRQDRGFQKIDDLKVRSQGADLEVQILRHGRGEAVGQAFGT